MRRSPEFIDDWFQLGKEGDEVQLVDYLDGSAAFIVPTQHKRLEEGVIKVFSKLEDELFNMASFLIRFYFES